MKTFITIHHMISMIYFGLRVYPHHTHLKATTSLCYLLLHKSLMQKQHRQNPLCYYTYITIHYATNKTIFFIITLNFVYIKVTCMLYFKRISFYLSTFSVQARPTFGQWTLSSLQHLKVIIILV